MKKKTERVPAQRQMRILSELQGHGVLSTSDIAALVGASEVTIRRDLDVLAEQGMLERTHGGAVLNASQTFEPDTALEQNRAPMQKRMIADRAVELITPGSSILIDCGSTAFYLAERLVKYRQPLTVVTSDIAVAATLRNCRNLEVIVPGGVLRHGTNSLTGEVGLEFYSQIKADICFLTCHAIDGMSVYETDLAAAKLKFALVRSAKRIILMADSGKFGRSAFRRIATMSEIDEIVTDDGLKEDQFNTYADVGIRMHLVTS